MRWLRIDFSFSWFPFPVTAKAPPDLAAPEREGLGTKNKGNEVRKRSALFLRDFFLLFAIIILDFYLDLGYTIIKMKGG